MRTLVSIAMVLAVAHDASAECPEKATYNVTSTKTGDAIVVTGPLRCDATRPLVRESVEAGQVALITECDGQGAWLDRCPVNGVVRYGLATEPSCDCGSVRSYGETSVKWGVLQCEAIPVDPSNVAWKDGRTMTCTPPTVNPAPAPVTAGCNIGGDGSSDGWLALGLVLLAVSRRRR